MRPFNFPTVLLSLLLSSISVQAFNSVNNAKDELQIRNKISLYALAIDAKDFALLSQVFTSDTSVNYNVPDSGPLNGLPAVQAYLKKALDGYVTQHTLSTTVVEQGTGKKEGPTSTVYLVANYLGQGNQTGKLLGFYGRYLDTWAKEGGEWKIKTRELKLFPPGIVGDISILTG